MAEGMRRAIVVASSRFDDSHFQPLQFPVRDAERFRDILADPALCGFDEVVLLENEPVMQVRRRLERATRASEPGDLLLFYYSGHGKVDRDGALALAMTDSDSETLRSTSLASDEIKALFNASRASQKVMILDCCYSGAMGSHGFKGAVSDSINSLAQQFTGSFLLTASRGVERAWELADRNAGALTEALVEGVRSGNAGASNDHITLAEIAAYARRVVPASSPQLPEYWDHGGIGGLIFSRKAARRDAGWGTKARRRVTQMVTQGILDEHLAEEMREAIAAPDLPRHERRVELIDQLLGRRLAVSAFVSAWARVNDREPKPERESEIEPEREPEAEPEPIRPPRAAPRPPERKDAPVPPSPPGGSIEGPPEGGEDATAKILLWTMLTLIGVVLFIVILAMANAPRPSPAMNTTSYPYAAENAADAADTAAEVAVDASANAYNTATSYPYDNPLTNVIETTPPAYDAPTK